MSPRSSSMAMSGRRLCRAALSLFAGPLASAGRSGTSMQQFWYQLFSSIALLMACGESDHAPLVLGGASVGANGSTMDAPAGPGGSVADADRGAPMNGTAAGTGSAAVAGDTSTPDQLSMAG